MDYLYRNSALLDLPMKMEQHDPTNVQALDVSGNDNHAQLGDGSTPATYPTKRTIGRGYSFDGGDHLELEDVNTLTYAGDSETIFFVASNVSAGVYFYASREGGIGGMTAARGAGGVLASHIGGILQATANTPIGLEMFSGCVVRTTNVSIEYYLNGVLDGGDYALTGTYTEGLNQYIGARGDGAGGVAFQLTGNIHMLLRFGQALTPLQIADLHKLGMKKGNAV
jgi:hypothetical protein